MRVFIALMLGLFGLGSAHAGCNNQSGVRTLAEATSWHLTQEGVSVQIGAGIGCTSIGTDQAYMRVNLSAGSTVLTDSTGNYSLNYIVSTQQNTGQLEAGTWTELISGEPNASALFNNDMQYPLFIQMSKIGALNGLIPGTYTGTLTLEYQYSIPLTDGTFATTGVTRPSGPINLDWGSGVEIVNLQLQVVVLPSCNIAQVNNIDFGDQPLVRRFSTQQVQIVVGCSAETTYSLSLDDGLNATAEGQRRMMSAAGNYLNYEVYKSNGTDRWGSNDAERWYSSAVVPNATNQRFHVARSRILSTATPPEGDYTDTLRVNVILP